MSDLLLILGAAALIGAAFMVAVVLGVAVLGAALVLFSLALADGKGFPWRS